MDRTSAGFVMDCSGHGLDCSHKAVASNFYNAYHRRPSKQVNPCHLPDRFITDFKSPAMAPMDVGMIF